jgi:hypothetical protein
VGGLCNATLAVHSKSVLVRLDLDLLGQIFVKELCPYAVQRVNLEAKPLQNPPLEKKLFSSHY